MNGLGYILLFLFLLLDQVEESKMSSVTVSFTLSFFCGGVGSTGSTEKFIFVRFCEFVNIVNNGACAVRGDSAGRLETEVCS